MPPSTRSARPDSSSPSGSISTPQSASSRSRCRRARAEVLNFCANNYLGLADHPDVVAAAKQALDALRLRPGLRPLHLRHAGAPQATRGTSCREFLGTDDTILYSLLLRRQRRPVRDAARRGGRRHLRRAEPRQHHRRRPPLQGPALPLQEQRHGRPGSAAAGGRRTRALPPDRHRRRLLDGRLHRQRSPAICDLADKYDALVMVDDSHAAGFIGATGRGTPEHYGVMDRIDIITGTLGKALGGASRRLHQRRARRSSTSCASARARTCSPTPCRRRSPRASLKVLDLLSERRRAARPARRATRRSSASG